MLNSLVHRGGAVAVALLLVLCPARGQQPLDLFEDAPALADGFIRIGFWNLCHINIEGDADDFLPGATDERRSLREFRILAGSVGRSCGSDRDAVDLVLDLGTFSES